MTAVDKSKSVNKTWWRIDPVNPELYPNVTEYIPSDRENRLGIRFVKQADLFRLYHPETKSYLLTHDVASPLTKTNMEMTTNTENANMTIKYAKTVWKFQVTDSLAGQILRTRRNHFEIINGRSTYYWYWHSTYMGIDSSGS